MLREIDSKRKVLLIVVVAFANIAYFISRIELPSSELLLLSFVAEAVFIYLNRWQGVDSIYERIGALWALFKVSLFAYISGYNWVIFPFILIEVYGVFFHQAGYYFKYFATAVPYLNAKNYTRLDKLRLFDHKLDKYRKATFVKPLIQSIVMLTIIFHEKYYLLYFVLAVLTLFIVKLLIDCFRYFSYLRSKQYGKDIKNYIDHLSPEVIVYVSGAKGSVYQLKQWVEVFCKLDKRVLVIAREKFWIIDMMDSPLHTVYARGMADLEKFITSDTRMCLYPTNAFKNTQMMRQTGLVHVFINHGESDKIINTSRFVKAYDKLYLAGQMARDRLEMSGVRLQDESISFVGRPQTSLYIKPVLKKTGRILYAPTWEGFDLQSDYSSIERFSKVLVENIIERSEYDIIFKPHPLTGSRKRKLQSILQNIENVLKETGRGEYIRHGNVLDLMNDCDKLITDISSVMNDFLTTGKPYIVTNTSGMDPSQFEERYKTVRGGYVLSNGSDINEIIELIDDTDPKKSERIELRKYSLGDFSVSDFEKFKLEIEYDCAAV